MDNAQRLSKMANYLELLQLDLRRGSLKKITPICPLISSSKKCLTLANSGKVFEEI